MKSSEVALSVDLSKAAKRRLDTICVLMEHESDLHSLTWAMDMGEEIAKKHARGQTSYHCMKPALGNLIQNNLEFFEALCEEGVVEWLTPLVMRKTPERG